MTCHDKFMADLPEVDMPFLQLIREVAQQQLDKGVAEYGEPLKPNQGDGRDSEIDALEEAIDLTLYLIKLVEEGNEKYRGCLDVSKQLVLLIAALRSAVE